jgi:hypothetical protein
MSGNIGKQNFAKQGAVRREAHFMFQSGIFGRRFGRAGHVEQGFDIKGGAV